MCLQLKYQKNKKKIQPESMLHNLFEISCILCTFPCSWQNNRNVSHRIREHLTILSPNISSGNKKNAVFIFILLLFWCILYVNVNAMKMRFENGCQEEQTNTLHILCHLLNFYGHSWWWWRCWLEHFVSFFLLLLLLLLLSSISTINV